MTTQLIQKKEVKPNLSYREIKEKIKNQRYKTCSLKHDLIKDKYPGVIMNRFFWDYNEVLNSIIQEIYNSIIWKEWKIERDDDPNYKQKRLYPRYRKDGDFKTELRYKYIENWEYSAHWINSAIDSAFSIIDSWKKNYDKGKRKRDCPVAKRLFVRIKQSLMKIEKIKDKKGRERDRLRISIKPRMFVYINLSKRYFKINGRIGEPILTPEYIHLPIEQNEENNKDNKDKKKVVKSVGWDLNKYSMDGFSPELGWIRIDLNRLHKVHTAYDNKRRRINRLSSKKKVVGKRLKDKYSKREKNRCRQIAHEIINEAKEIGIHHGFEDLNKSGMFFKRGKKWNRELGYTNWKDITRIMEYKSSIELIDPYHTSKDCSRCGCVNKDLKGEKFVCKNCGLEINRQFNAAINVYLKMEGLSHNVGWFDENVVSEFTQTGAECVKANTARKETNELVRSLYDLKKPQFYEERCSKCT